MESDSPKQFGLLTLFQKISWNVTQKIAVCFAVLVALVIISSSITLIAILQFENTSEVRRHTNQVLTDARLLEQQLDAMLNAYIDTIFITHQPTVNGSYVLHVKDSLSRLENRVTNIPDEAKATYAAKVRQLIKSHAEFGKIIDEVNRNLLEKNLERAMQLWQLNDPLREFLISAQRQLVQQLEIEDTANVANTSFTATLTKITAVTLGVLSSIFAVFFAWLLAGAFGKPLARLQKFLENVSHGDFSGNLYLNNRDELGTLAAVINLTVNTFRGIIESVNIGTQISDASFTLNEISNSQATSADQQVSYVSQISTAMHELTQTAQYISHSAEEVDRAAQTTLKQVQQLSETSSEVGTVASELRMIVDKSTLGIEKTKAEFNHLNNELSKLDEHSNNSQRVIGIITEIASQTHMLSLNAAIEAAGAGQYGERFKVVAHEIKTLANRSATATAEVKTIIETMRSNIQDIRGLALERYEDFNDIALLGEHVQAATQQTLKKVAANQDSVMAILQASQNSSDKSHQIKTTSYQQQAASQQVLLDIQTILQAASRGELNSRQLAGTSTQLNELSHSLNTRLAELKLSVRAV